MSACLAETRARPCPGRDAITGQRFGAAPSFAVIAERHGGQSAMPTRGPAHFARVRRMRLRSTTTTTTTGATTWRVRSLRDGSASLVAEGPFPA